MSDNRVMIDRLKILFIISSTSQVEMFANICNLLTDCDFKVINVDRLKYKSDIEKMLKDSNLPAETLSGLNIRSIEKIFAEEQPDALVFGHDRNILEQLFIQAANSKGIPTLLVQDGIRGSSREELFVTESKIKKIRYWVGSPIRAFSFFIKTNYSWKQKIEIALFEAAHGYRGGERIWGHGECSQIVVFSDSVKRMLIAENVDSARIFVAGNPKFDNYFYLEKESCKEKVCRNWNFPANNHIILLLTQYFVEAGIWSLEQRRSFVLAVSEAAARIPGTRLIIKLHPPHENIEDYEEIVKEISPAPIICKYHPLTELLNSCSLAITVSSTAGLEAMAMKRPVMIIDLYNRGGSSFYQDSGALFARTVKDILPLMRKALFDAQTKDEMNEITSGFVFDQAYLQDGKASQRIADLIKSKASNKNITNKSLE